MLAIPAYLLVRIAGFLAAFQPEDPLWKAWRFLQPDFGIENQP